MELSREEAACLCQEAEPMALDHCLLRTTFENDDDDEEDEDDDADFEEDFRMQIDSKSHRSKFRMTLQEVLPYSSQDKRVLKVFNCVTSRPCVVCVYLALLLVLLCSFISLIVISFLVAAPYTEAAHFVTGECTCVGSVWGREEEQCSCGKGCSSKYPCLKVSVNITLTNGNIATATLAEDETNLHQKVGPDPRGFTSHHSLLPCMNFMHKL